MSAASPASCSSMSSMSTVHWSCGARACGVRDATRLTSARRGEAGGTTGGPKSISTPARQHTHTHTPRDAPSSSALQWAGSEGAAIAAIGRDGDASCDRNALSDTEGRNSGGGDRGAPYALSGTASDGAGDVMRADFCWC